MKAIVLTCDEYHPLVDHMIETYQRIWPSNPFVFRIPYQNQNYLNYLKIKYEDKIELIRTEKPIKATVNNLLKDIEDEEFIYWCIDDKYLIKANENKLNEVFNFVQDIIQYPEISGILFCRCRGLNMPKNLNYKDKIGKGKLIFINRKNYTQIWLHQFLRAKVLKQLFETFPDDPFVAKQMDDFIWTKQLPLDTKLYVSQKNLAIYGESTSRSKLTSNCVKSIKAYDLQRPKNFELCKDKITMGRLPWQFFGIRIPNVIDILSRLKNQFT